MKKKLVDCIYIAACSRDARLTRICVASIRYFYPEIPIRLLAGDFIQKGLDDELKKYWGVDMVDLEKADYGWGLVKLEPLFMNPGESFLVMDVDTVMTGKILEKRAKSDAPFFVDDEQLSDSDFKRLYYDWDKMRMIDDKAQTARNAFNVGQWFGTGGLIKRADFDRWVDWSFPRRLIYQQYFMGGDQGVMNYVILQKEAYEGLKIDRTTFMRWPGNGMEDLTEKVVESRNGPELIVHWAGMKKWFLSKMIGSDLLLFYERYYYSRLPMSKVKYFKDICYHFYLQSKHYITVRVHLLFKKYLGIN